MLVNVKWFLILTVLYAISAAVSCPAQSMPQPGSIDAAVHMGFMLFAQNGDAGQRSMDDMEEDPEYSDEEDIEYLEEEDFDYMEDEEELEGFSDPLESSNRAMFKFNDRLYLWVLNPVAKGYAYVIPEGIRISVRNVFSNIATPIRLVNSLLQGKAKPAGNEILRFGINSTFGMLGLFDVAKSEFSIKKSDEDFGQTLGVWGAGPGIYLHWPFFGPSSTRDTVGFVGDYFLDPLNYIVPAAPSIERFVLRGAEAVNKVSLSLGDYEEIKKDALDPYDAFKDIYYQYRKSKLER